MKRNPVPLHGNDPPESGDTPDTTQIDASVLVFDVVVPGHCLMHATATRKLADHTIVQTPGIVCECGGFQMASDGSLGGEQMATTMARVHRLEAAAGLLAPRQPVPIADPRT